MNNRNIDNPWRGLAPYDGSEKPEYFCGRKNDIKHLRQLIEDNACVVFYGASGVGKTSVLRAGIMPILKLYNYLPLYIRLSETDSSKKYSQTIIERLSDFTEVRDSSESALALVDSDKPWGLWKYFCTNHFFYDNHEVVPVIVLDQFEEVFRGGDKDRVDLLLSQIYTLINGSVSVPHGFEETRNYRFLISMREDFLFVLEDSIDRMGLSLLKNARFRLRPLNKEQAKQVITICPNLLPKDNDEYNEVVKALINSSVQDGEVSTLLLSLICYRAYNIKKGPIIDMRTVDELGKQPLKVFCDEVLKGINQDAINFIVKKTIDDNGFRLPVGQKSLKKNKVPQCLWDDNNPERLFVMTSRKGVGADNTDVYYELIHDQLALAILDYRHEITIRSERKEKEKLQVLQSRLLAEKATQLVEEGDSYLARMLALKALPMHLDNPDKPFVPEAEGALRNAIKYQPNTSVATIHFKDNATIGGLTISNDGNNIAVCVGSHIEIVDLESGAITKKTLEHDSMSFLSTIAYSRDGVFLFTGDKNGSIKIWDVDHIGDAEELIMTIPISSVTITMISAHPSENLLAIATDNKIHVYNYDPYSSEEIYSPLAHLDHVNSVLFNKTGDMIISSSDDKTVIIWNTHSGTNEEEFSGREISGFHDNMIRSASFSPDETKIITASEDGLILITDRKTKK